MRDLVIDLFAGGGGAGEGYSRAGLEVVGVELDAKVAAKNPHAIYVGDWRDGLNYWLPLADRTWSAGASVLIHASPVCKGYTVSSLSWRMKGREYPNQIPEVREALTDIGYPFVIENTPGAPLVDPVELCGCQFNLRTQLDDGTECGLQRRRLFEAHGFTITPPSDHDKAYHALTPVTVAGHGQPSWTRAHGTVPVRVKQWREAMGIDWLPRDMLAQAIPPAYTEHIGLQFLAQEYGRIAA